MGKSSTFCPLQIHQIMLSELFTKDCAVDNKIASLFTAPVPQPVIAKSEPPAAEPTENTTEIIVQEEKPQQRKRPKHARNNDEDEDVLEMDSTDPNATQMKKNRDTPEKLLRTVFVGNVSSLVNDKANLSMFKALFKECGEIESIRFRSIALAKPMPRKIGYITKQFNTNRDTFNAYVVYKTAEQAAVAVEALNGTLFLEKHLRVDRCLTTLNVSNNDPEATGVSGKTKAEKKMDAKRCVFVGNLDYRIEDEALYQHFQVCGDIEYVRIIRDRATGMGKGFGYVCFQDAASTVLALELNNEKLNDRELRVTECSMKLSIASSDKKINRSGYEARKKDRVKKGKKGDKKKEKKIGKNTDKKPRHGKKVSKK